MRSTIIVVFLILSISCMAQIKLNPRVGVDITDGEKFSIGSPFTYYDEQGVRYTKAAESIVLPHVKSLIGIEINYKKLSLIFDNTTWENLDFNALRFAPTQSRFDVMLELQLFTKLKMGVTHACYHPIRVSESEGGSMFGGFSSLYFHYGY